MWQLNPALIANNVAARGGGGAPAEPSAIVSGAGTASVNGTYTERGTNGGKPFYTLEGHATPPDPEVDEFSITWIAGTNWTIDCANGLYTTSEDVAFPWLVVSWDINNGEGPAPSVTEG